jgi:hypothetical protein
MLVPHLVFLGSSLAFKIIFPNVLSWLAVETYATALLSIWYPMIWTIGWIHSQRNPEDPVEEPTPNKSVSVEEQVQRLDTQKKSTSKPSPTKSKRQPSYMRATAAQQLRAETTQTRGTRTGIYPRTTPTKKVEPSSPIRSAEKQQRRLQEVSTMLDPTDYWIRYWIVYACVQAAGRVLFLTPIIGRILTKHALLVSWTAEAQLVFFIWIFGMEQIMAQVASQNEDGVFAQALPLKLVYDKLAPVLIKLQAVVSEAVSEEMWQSMVISKTRKVLEVFVLVRFLSVPWKDWLLHVLEQSRALLVPSITLLMPGFITGFGVAYVQYIVPSSKSVQTHNDSATKLLYLQYWVLNCFLSGWLAWFASLLWWIPFSTHVTYLLWCHLSFPRTITQYYDILEFELIAFGILSKQGQEGMAVPSMEEARTMRFVKVLAARLPSATMDGSNELEDVATASIDTDKQAPVTDNQEANTNNRNNQDVLTHDNSTASSVDVLVEESANQEQENPTTASTKKDDGDSSFGSSDDDNENATNSQDKQQQQELRRSSRSNRSKPPSLRMQ